MKYLIFTFLAISVLVSCKKETLTFQQQLEVEDEIITTYLSDNGITAIKDPSGIYYVIDEAGSGSTFPTASSLVSMAYKGMLLDGSVFDSTDSTNPLKTYLYNLITGWQIGIPKFKKGGKGTLYIPSGYGYGIGGSSGIPGNSVLIFDIELLDFTN